MSEFGSFDDRLSELELAVETQRKLIIKLEADNAALRKALGVGVDPTWPREARQVEDFHIAGWRIPV